MFLDELDLLDIQYTGGNRTEVMEKLDSQIDSGLTQLHINIGNIINPKKLSKITLFWFKKATQIDSGSSFGERALIKNDHRAATIICSQDCTFATLSRANYNLIMGLR